MALYKTQLHWGDYAPALYTATHPTKGNKVGIGLMYERQPQDALFNIWLWQNNFVTPQDLTYEQARTFALDWPICEAIAELEHENTELGVAALMFSPEEFGKFLKGFHKTASVLGKSYRIRRPVAA